MEDFVLRLVAVCSMFLHRRFSGLFQSLELIRIGRNPWLSERKVRQRSWLGVTVAFCLAAVYSLTVGHSQRRPLVKWACACFQPCSLSRLSLRAGRQKHRAWNVKDWLWALSTARGLSPRNVRTLNKQRRGSDRPGLDTHAAECRGLGWSCNKYST